MTSALHTPQKKSPDMLSNELSYRVRTLMIISGVIGFGVGCWIGYLRDVDIPGMFFRGALLCTITAFMIRWVSLLFFRAHVDQLHEERKLGAVKLSEPEPPKVIHS